MLRRYWDEAGETVPGPCPVSVFDLGSPLLSTRRPCDVSDGSFGSRTVAGPSVHSASAPHSYNTICLVQNTGGCRAHNGSPKGMRGVRYLRCRYFSYGVKSPLAAFRQNLL